MKEKRPKSKSRTELTKKTVAETLERVISPRARTFVLLYGKVIAAMLVVIFPIVFIFANFTVPKDYLNVSVGFLSALTGIGVIALSARYLLDYLKLQRPRDPLDYRSDIKMLYSLIEQRTQAPFSEREKAELQTALLAEIKGAAANKTIEEIVQRLNDSLPQTILIEAVERRYQQSVKRLTGEIEALGNRGNVNLVIGILIAFIGLGMLGYILFTSTISVSTTQGSSQMAEAISAALWRDGLWYLPKLSFVLAVELFAYFFLRLYKVNLTEIKYFQNELTNLEGKYVALRFAIASDDNSLKSKVVEELCKTERNFILKKDESTVYSEQFRVENEFALSLAKTFSEVLDKAKK
jgi:hypothetical protein